MFNLNANMSASTVVCKLGNTKLYDKPFVGSRVVTCAHASGQSWRSAMVEMGKKFYKQHF